MSDLADRVRAVNQRWLATMGLDDETQALEADIRERADALRRQHGPRPSWWRPIARRRWSRLMAGVEARVIEAMLEERLAEERTEHPYRQLVAEVPRRPWSKPRCMAVGDAIHHVREVGKPGCQCGFEDDRRAIAMPIAGPGRPSSR